MKKAKDKLPKSKLHPAVDYRPTSSSVPEHWHETTLLHLHRNSNEYGKDDPGHKSLIAGLKLPGSKENTTIRGGRKVGSAC